MGICPLATDIRVLMFDAMSARMQIGSELSKGIVTLRLPELFFNDSNIVGTRRCPHSRVQPRWQEQADVLSFSCRILRSL